MLEEINTRGEHYFVDEQARIQGTFKKFYMTGILFVNCFYIDNKRHGEYTAWSSSGQLWRHCIYANDRKHGECKELGDGKDLIHCFYVNGKYTSFNEIPYPTTPEEHMLFKLKYDLQLFRNS